MTTLTFDSLFIIGWLFVYSHNLQILIFQDADFETLIEPVNVIVMQVSNFENFR